MEVVSSNVIIKVAQIEHSAVYYCAARYAQWQKAPLNTVKTAQFFVLFTFGGLDKTSS